MATAASSWQDYSFTGNSGYLAPAFRKAGAHLRDHFLPHEGNNYQPHVLSQRFLGLLSIFLVGVKFAILAAVAFSPAASIFASAITTGNVLALTNQSRLDYHLSALAFNGKLAQAAQAKADDMAAKGYFAHTTPDGRSPWSFIQAAGYSYISAGENLAVDFTEAENVEVAWMNSPGHRANILNKNYEEIGIGIAKGQYQGHDTTFVVQMFGTPVEQQITLQSQPTSLAPVPAQPPAPASQPAAQTPAASEPASAPVQIVDTSTELRDGQLWLSVTTSGPVTKVVANYNGAATMLYPKSDSAWQGAVSLPALTGENNLTVVASDMQGNSRQAPVVSFAPSLQSNYQLSGAVKGATVSVFGTNIDLKAFEQKFYLIMIAALLTCLVLAIAVKRHVQHVSLVANSSFVVILAALLWMAG